MVLEVSVHGQLLHGFQACGKLETSWQTGMHEELLSSWELGAGRVKESERKGQGSDVVPKVTLPWPILLLCLSPPHNAIKL